MDHCADLSHQRTFQTLPKFVVATMGRLVKKFQMPLTYNPSKRSVDERAGIEQSVWALTGRCSRIRSDGHVETVRQALKGEACHDSECSKNGTESPGRCIGRQHTETDFKLTTRGPGRSGGGNSDWQGIVSKDTKALSRRWPQTQGNEREIILVFLCGRLIRVT